MQIYTPESIWLPRVSSDKISQAMWKKTPFKGYVYFSFGLNLILIVAILVLRDLLPPVVPLFYGLPIGTDQLISTTTLVVAPIAGLVITLTNVFISNLLSDGFLRRSLIISSGFVSLLLAITVIKIVLLVGFF